MIEQDDITRIFPQTVLEKTLGCNDPSAARSSPRAQEPAGRVFPQRRATGGLFFWLSIAGECLACVIAACALLVAWFHAMLGLWFLAFITLFVAGALSFAAAMFAILRGR